MNTILKKQEVAQGVKLGSFKEFETLNSNELKGIEGGFIGFNWGLFWRGFGVGVGAGTAGAVAYYSIA